MKTYTISEFLHKDDKKSRGVDKFISTFVGAATFATPVYADDIGEKIRKIGEQCVYYIKLGGKWFFICICVIECIKAVLGKRPSDVPGIMIKYLLAYGCFNIVVLLFDLIDKVLG